MHERAHAVPERIADDAVQGWRRKRGHGTSPYECFQWGRGESFLKCSGDVGEGEFFEKAFPPSANPTVSHLFKKDDCSHRVSVPRVPENADFL